MLVQEKLIKFATRIPAFMYLTDFRENTLRDVITKLEPELFLSVTGLTVKDFHLLVQLKVFNTEQMNQAVFAFRRYEDASLSYTVSQGGTGQIKTEVYDDYAAAKAKLDEGSEEAMIVFYNTRLALCWARTKETTRYDELMQRAEPYRLGTVPMGGADSHRRHRHPGLSTGDESRRLGRRHGMLDRRLPGHPWITFR